MSIKTSIAVVLLALAAGGASSQNAFGIDLMGDAALASGGFLTGQELYARGSDDAFVVGYIAGISDADRGAAKRMRPASCIPNGVSLGQMIDVTWKYLRDNPSTRHEPAAFLVREAMIASWPCSTR
ncbi:MAG: hypothetical protein HYX42_04165 [Polaromonas sp.]|uniref:Rap1a/Tai family immunity protein n=1 Tax=Polaromonas sp. TaxID=1869339 RepID=UPI0025CDBF62|nr:Rap1a/Tai family immunity protein [Polaromonas sp.]MBI2725425.1 hypothetical protein [Polaromonas sp.]